MRLINMTLLVGILAVILTGCAINQSGPSVTDLHTAVQEGNPETIQRLIDQGGNVNAPDPYGMTPLHVAAWTGRPESTRLLLDNGADPNQLDNKQRTPRDLAAERGHQATETILKQATGRRNTAPDPMVRGRWHLDQNAGKAMIQSARQARDSIVLMTKVFDTQEPVVEDLAQVLQEAAADGVDVTLILSKDFPYSSFNDKNDRTEEFFKDTEVQVLRLAATGQFSPDGIYQPQANNPNYVNSAVFLVDGQDLFAGNFIFTEDGLHGSTNSILQLRGEGVLDEVAPYMSQLAAEHGFSWRPPAPEAEIKPNPEWPEVYDFKFHLGQSLEDAARPVTGHFDERLVMSSEKTGSAETPAIEAILEPIRNRTTSGTVELFYETCLSSNHCLVEDLRAMGHQTYQYKGSDKHYIRLAVSDLGSFYTGTADIYRGYVGPSSYDSIVSGESRPLANELLDWFDKQKN